MQIVSYGAGTNSAAMPADEQDLLIRAVRSDGRVQRHEGAGMTTPEVVWQLFDDWRMRSLPGAVIQCSLFGRIKPVFVDGGWLGEIPNWLKKEAAAHGLNVIGADFKSDVYTFQVKEL